MKTLDPLTDLSPLADRMTIFDMTMGREICVNLALTLTLFLAISLALFLALSLFFSIQLEESPSIQLFVPGIESESQEKAKTQHDPQHLCHREERMDLG
jgi:ABC-type enterochelin transport system permease subunit